MFSENNITTNQPRDPAHCTTLLIDLTLDQTPLTHLQSPHNHPTSVSPPPHLCSTSSQHSLFISRYRRSTTNIIFDH